MQLCRGGHLSICWPAVIAATIAENVLSLTGSWVEKLDWETHPESRPHVLGKVLGVLVPGIRRGPIPQGGSWWKSSSSFECLVLLGFLIFWTTVFNAAAAISLIHPSVGPHIIHLFSSKTMRAASSFLLHLHLSSLLVRPNLAEQQLPRYGTEKHRCAVSISLLATSQRKPKSLEKKLNKLVHPNQLALTPCQRSLKYHAELFFDEFSSISGLLHGYCDSKS